MRILGDYWENIALKFLSSKGLKKICRNFQSKMGEIDLIMIEHENTLVFVEVKFRTNSNWVSAAESVTLSKQRKIIKTAQLYLLQNKKYHNWNCRFDVVSIQGNKQNPEIDWITNAFY